MINHIRFKDKLMKWQAFHNDGKVFNLTEASSFCHIMNLTNSIGMLIAVGVPLEEIKEVVNMTIEACCALSNSIDKSGHYCEGQLIQVMEEMGLRVDDYGNPIKKGESES